VGLDNDFTTVKSMAVLIDNPKSHKKIMVTLIGESHPSNL
jgi:hypothetical protein